MLTLRPRHSHYARIVLHARYSLLCSKLCPPNWRSPTSLVSPNRTSARRTIRPRHSHYARIVLHARYSLLCSKLCLPNRRNPTSLMSPNRTSARRTPMACTQWGDMLKHNLRWLQTVRKNLFRVFQQLSILPSERLVLQASFAKGVTLEISERLESRNECYMAQWAERVDTSCKKKTLSSGLREASFWPKNSNLMASKFQQIYWGRGMPPDPPTCCMLTYTSLTRPLQIWWDGYGPVVQARYATG